MHFVCPLENCRRMRLRLAIKRLGNIDYLTPENVQEQIRIRISCVFFYLLLILLYPQKKDIPKIPQLAKMAKLKKKLTREERLEKKRKAERLHDQRIKNDPIKNAELKEKEKYHRKNEKGQVRSIKDLTNREQQAVRKIWREKTEM
ncbi:unnamed protein product [Acanthoscelides obtectus]|uniref:Uncharacterized protein n=1 Tax=Acanthoscelides obtectus TaxID=200917 RepID=A0A9P0Q9P1_ACAOB|nr:unnamed protein product [Acanthoscelides obtectus]CAK1677754.1 hypothetical protein AOBTE_LOCUS31537 [Acanthoscelides obtectus]